ncbi:MAG: hypothetical protein IKN96_07985 [Oscillibacter sp.]|nr:hypothetical protein [Oscillibacter sp.]
MSCGTEEACKTAARYPELFKPFQIGRCKIKNRIAMAPMRLDGRMGGDGNMTDEVIDCYEARADRE